MRKEVDFNQAVKNGARAAFEEAEYSFAAMGVRAERHLATARFLEHERAVAYWQAVVRLCRQNAAA